MTVKNEVVHGAFLGLVLGVGLFLFLLGFAMGDIVVVVAGAVVAIAALLSRLIVIYKEWSTREV